MKHRIKTALVEGLLLGIFMGVFFSIVYGLTIGIISGLALGLAFGIIMYIFMKSQSKKFDDIRVEIQKKENVLFDGSAYHYMGNESVGGWLFLTDKSLFFISHKYNLQRHAMEIPLENIKEINTESSLIFVPNCMIIITKGGKSTKLVINQRSKWIKLLKENMQAA